VTGIDVSLGLIHAAKRLADERGVDIVYEVKDATDVAWREAFHHAIVAYNSFSLFSPGAAPVVLKGLYRSLKPSGRLFMDLDNQRFERRRYQYANPLRGWYTWPGGLTLQEVYFHNDSSVEVSRDVIFKTTATRAETFMTFKKLYSQDEIENLLSSCSFHVEEIYGDWDLSPLRTNSSKMLLIAVRK
jgi:ubiquinone/menaquinone biosynthesis C-methylase UbiE